MDQEAGRSAALHEAGQRLEAILNNATVAILLMDHRQHCTYMNRAAEQLTGYSFDEVTSLNRPLHDIIHHTYPDGRPFPLQECAIDRAFPEHNQTQGEEVFVHKDGSFYPVAFTASPIRDEDAQAVGTIIELRDIREEKLAQERQRLLVDELNHRARNTLATIQSVARQSLKDVDPAVVARFEGRLAALSAAHNILTITSWQGARIMRIIQTVSETFGADRFDLEGPVCDLDPKAAVSLSMALHELGSNAVSFGALSTDPGRVSIDWHIEGENRLELVWQEMGGPPVEPPARRGFGLRLVERQLAMEFGGSVDLDFRPEGLLCTIRLILPPVSEPLDLTHAANVDRND